MSLALILIIVLVIVLLAVKKKISAIHEAIDLKLETLSRLSDKGAVLMGAIKRVATLVKK